MDIRNNNDLRLAYWIIYTMADTAAKATGMDRETAAAMLKHSDTIIDIKRRIRAYLHDADANRRTLVKGDTDGSSNCLKCPTYRMQRGGLMILSALHIGPACTTVLDRRLHAGTRFLGATVS